MFRSTKSPFRPSMVDVSKARLDACIEPGAVRGSFKNDAAGIAAQAAFCQTIKPAFLHSGDPFRTHGIDGGAMPHSSTYGAGQKAAPYPADAPSITDR